MQTAEPLNPLGAWSQHQMIRIAQYDVCAGLFDLVHVERFDGASCPDWHEGRGADIAARSRQDARAGCALCCVKGERKARH
mgnify:CR=1 FL=1